MTTILFTSLSLMYLATASRLRPCKVFGGVLSSTGTDDSFPILPLNPTFEGAGCFSRFRRAIVDIEIWKNGAACAILTYNYILLIDMEAEDDSNYWNLNDCVQKGSLKKDDNIAILHVILRQKLGGGCGIIS